MNLIKIQKYLTDLKKDFENSAYVINDSFDFLHKLLNNLKKNEKIFSDTTLKIYDYRDDSIFFIDKMKAQSILDELYLEYYYNFFLKKHKDCQLIFSKISNFYSLDYKDSFVFFKIVLTSISVSIDSFDFTINFSKLTNLILKQGYFIPCDIREKWSQELIKILIEEKIFILEKKLNKLVLSNHCLALDLIYLSVNSLEITKSDNISSIYYSCYYGIATLVFVVKKFLSTRTFFDIDVKFNKFYEDYSDLDFERFKSIENNYNYSFLKLIYIDKLILNDYIFHCIITSCFEKYIFSSKRKNVLYDKSGDFFNRLIP